MQYKVPKEFTLMVQEIGIFQQIHYIPDRRYMEIIINGARLQISYFLQKCKKGKVVKTILLLDNTKTQSFIKSDYY